MSFPSGRTTIAIVLGLLAPARSATAAPTGGSLHLATCATEAGEYRATLRYHVLLAKDFLDPTQPLDSQLRDAVKQQLHYIWGWYRTHKDIPNAPQLVLGAEEPEVILGTQTPATYGADLVLDWDEKAPDLQIVDPYTVRAIRRGFIHKDDPALQVDYIAHFPIALCGPAREAASTLDAAVPADPWLMHWRVPARERRRLRYFDETAVTNPCVDDDYADLPHPFYHWYDWLPERHGPDDEGKPFDCRTLLHSGVDYFPVTVELERTASPTNALDTLRARLGGGPAEKRRLGATFLFGTLDPAFKGMGYPEMQRTLGTGSGAELFERTRLLLGHPRDPLERGSGMLVRWLAGLEPVVAVEHYESALEDGFLRVVVTGRLRRSARPVELQSFLGFTNVFGPTPHHWDILRRGLVSSDVIVYAGHSGIGENFRLTQIEQHLKLDRGAFADELRRSPYQLVAFLSCYSYMYFGRDLEGASALGGSGREFVYTGTPFTKQDRGALAILDLIDAVSASPPGARPALQFVDPSDFLMFKGTAPPLRQ